MEKTCLVRVRQRNGTNYREICIRGDLLQKLAHEFIRVEKSHGLPYVN